MVCTPRVLSYAYFDVHTFLGSVVRIGPNEVRQPVDVIDSLIKFIILQLHFNHQNAFSDIYSVESRFTKEPTFYACFNAKRSAFGAIDPTDSKTRRGAMHTLFSRRSILDIEKIIRRKVSPRQTVMICSLKLFRRPTSLCLNYRTCQASLLTCSLR